MALLCFFVWYYPVGFYRNAEPTDSVHIRGFLSLLIVWVTFLMASSLAHMLIAGVDSEDMASAYATLLSIMMYAFCGILAGPNDLPRFWIFAYRVNPFTYLVSSFMSATIGDASAFCADNEFQVFSPPDGQTCGKYMEAYMEVAGGYLRNENDTGVCHYCQLGSTNQFLQILNVEWDNRWRDFGILWTYVVINTAGAVLFYWLFRVPKGKKEKKAKVA
jgi:ATP-binding cassette, subfamily G (WHITE), member 2, PDR